MQLGTLFEKGVLISVLLGLIGGYLIYSGLPDTTLMSQDERDMFSETELSQPEQHDINLSLPETPSAFFMLYGVEEGNSEKLKGKVKFITREDNIEVLSSFLIGKDDMVFLTTNLFTKAARRENTFILPYKRIGTTGLPVVYAREGSGISNLSQVKGGKIALPGGGVSQLLTWFAMNHKYGINSSNTDIRQMNKSEMFQALEKEKIDVVQTITKAPKSADLKPIFYPSKYFQRNEELSRPPVGLFMIADRDIKEEGIEIVKLLDKAAQRGTSEVEKVINYSEVKTGRTSPEVFRSDAKVNGGDLIVPLTEKDEKTLQMLFDFSYRSNISSVKLNVSDRLVRED